MVRACPEDGRGQNTKKNNPKQNLWGHKLEEKG